MRERKTITVRELFGPPIPNGPPSGYHTAKDVARYLNCSEHTARHKLNEAGLDTVTVNLGRHHATAYRIELK